MMDAKSESDMTSVGTSSPKAQAAYYVQSPSRDSHDDGDKSSSSAMTTHTTTTPTYHSPTDSPSHPSYEPHSFSSSASRISGAGPFRWTQTSSCSGRKGRQREGGGWAERHAIGEGGNYMALYGDERSISPAKCRVLIGAFGLVMLLFVFCSVLWGASRPFMPRIHLKSFDVHSFCYGEGSDRTGVPTKMLTMNSSVKMTIHNPASFFGIHVTSSPLRLMYSQLTIATGQMKKYYQPQKSQHTVSVELVGTNVPLYGAGVSLAASDNSGGIPLKLVFEIKLRGNVVGTLVKSRHRRHLSCSLIIGSHGSKPVKFEVNSCKFSK